MLSLVLLLLIHWAGMLLLSLVILYARSGKGNHGGMLLHVTFQQMKSSSESK